MECSLLNYYYSDVHSIYCRYKDKGDVVDQKKEQIKLKESMLFLYLGGIKICNITGII